MNATRITTWQIALDLGKASRDAFWEETGDAPTTENEGGWEKSAWSCHWKELRDQGAVDADYDRCLELWQCGFYDREYQSQMQS